MSDEEAQELRRRALMGDDGALERLKRLWLRTHETYVEPATAEEPERTRARPIQFLPELGTVGARTYKEALFDYEFLERNEGGCQSVGYFQSTRTFASGAPKIFGIHTNLIGQGGGIPPWLTQHVYGVSLLPNAGTPLVDYYRLYNEGSLVFQLAQTPAITWPTRSLMIPPQLLPDSPSGVLELVQPLGAVRDVTVANRPLTLAPLDAFRLVLTCEGRLTERMGVMVLLFGLQTRGYTS